MTTEFLSQMGISPGQDLSSRKRRTDELRANDQARIPSSFAEIINVLDTDYQVLNENPFITSALLDAIEAKVAAGHLTGDDLLGMTDRELLNVGFVQNEITAITLSARRYREINRDSS